MIRRLMAFIEAETITGPAKNLLQFATMMQSARFEPSMKIAVAAFVRAGRPPNVFLETARHHGIATFEIPEKGRFDRTAITAMRAAVERFDADIVQTHAVKSHFLCRLAGLHRERPWIAFHHGYTWPDLRARMYNEFDRWSLRAASQVLTVSKPFQQQLEERGVEPRRIEIVHNAIDAGWGASANPKTAGEALRSQLGIAPGTPVLLIVGRLSREKDHETLLRAVARLPAAHLVIVGEGPDRPRIEAAVVANKLERRTSLTGHKPSAEPYYGIADIAILSSRTEGSPNALLEAMAAGIPAVATRVGGIPEIATDSETAILVEPEDDAAMAAAIARLLDDADLARSIAHRAQKHVLLHHSPEARMQRLWSIYMRVLGSERPKEL